MNYVKALNLLGVEARQLPALTGKGEPTVSTVGAVGELYMDTLNGNLYKCVATNGGSYTWTKEQGEKGADGKDGKSAYEYAREGGYSGTEEQYSAKLATPFATPQMYGAKGDGVTDDTEAIQAAIDANANLLITEGTYAIYGTIRLSGDKTVNMQNKAVLVKPADANNTDPVVWITGNYSSLVGSGMTNSYIRSQVESPYGVLLIGDKGMDATGINTLYNTVRDIGVEGHAKGGNSSGNDTKAVYVCCSDGYTYACYFNTLQNLYIAKANNGLMLEGYANANIVENIQFRHVGNEKYLDGAAIHLKNTNDRYPLENTITNAFHHESNNAVTLFFDGRVIYNSVQNIICEQMGSSAKGIKANHICNGNSILIIENTNSGNDIIDGFERNNVVIRRNSLATPVIRAKEAYLLNDKHFEKRSGFAISDCKDGKYYKLFSVEDPLSTIANQTILVEYDVNYGVSGSTAIAKSYAKAQFLLVFDASRNITVTEVSTISTNTNKFICKPIVEKGKVTFVTFCNKMTGGLSIRIMCNYRVVGQNSNIRVTTYETPTIAEGVEGRYLAALPQTTVNGATADRPTNATKGSQFFDTTLGKPVWYDGSGWVDATGTTV